MGYLIALGLPQLSTLFTHQFRAIKIYPTYHAIIFSCVLAWGCLRVLSLEVLQFSSVTQLCPILCDPMDCNTPGFPVHHQLPELAQTQVHQVDDAIQPSHSLFSHSPPTFNLSQHQSLFKWVRRPKYWSFSFNISPSNEYSRLNPLGLTGLISLQSKGLSRVFSNTKVQKHQFFGTQLSLWRASWWKWKRGVKKLA